MLTSFFAYRLKKLPSADHLAQAFPWNIGDRELHAMPDGSLICRAAGVLGLSLMKVGAEENRFLLCHFRLGPWVAG